MEHSTAVMEHAEVDKTTLEILGTSPAIREVLRKIQQVARSTTTVLLRGEMGTGKELAATAIHHLSPRCHGPLVKVNCAALGDELLESELFGHTRAAFPSMPYDRVGRIEEADGGTLFLDEVADFSPVMQVKLLRVLQEQEFERPGGNQTTRTDVRLIAATARNLEALVEAGAFRQDLYYRINVFPIVLPPLRERKEDLLLLAEHFAARYGRKMNKEVRRISGSAVNMMLSYDWPGNVRELENCIEYAVLLADEGAIRSQNLPAPLQSPAGGEAAPGSLKARVELLEKDMIVDALEAVGGNTTAAARQLGITPRMVRYKMKKLGIDYRRFVKRAGS